MIQKVISEMIQYFQSDVRRINHALKVYGFATAIAGLECGSGEERRVVALAAVLHDIGIKEAERKYNSTAGKYQEAEGPAIAGAILEKCGVEADVIERVCYLIGNHHSYGKIDGPDFQILVEADFLVNIYEDEMDGTSVESIREKYFHTSAGCTFIEKMYCRKP